MSDISDFIAEMDRDEENRKIEDEKYFQASDEKFQEMQKRLQLLKEENKRQMDIIMNSLDELIANKTVIDKALENAEEIVPIVNDDNLSIVDLLAKVTGYVNDNEMKNEISEITNNMSFMYETSENNETLNGEEKNDVEKIDVDDISDVTADIKDCEKESKTEEVFKNEETQVDKIDVNNVNEVTADIKDCEMESKTEEVFKNEETQVEKIDVDNVNKVTANIKDYAKESKTAEVLKNDETQVKNEVGSEKKEKETELCDSTKLLEKLNIGPTDDNFEDQTISDEVK